MVKTDYQYSYRKMIIWIIGVSIFLAIMHFLFISKFDTTVVQNFIHAIVVTTLMWLGCMGIVRLLWDHYPWEYHPRKHLVLEIILIAAYTALITFIAYKVQSKLGLIPHEEVGNLGREVLEMFLITFLISTIHEAVFFYKQWKINFSKSVKLEKDNMEAKYEMLKTQINPHFLFNSLNSLVTIVDDNPQAVKYVHDLSVFLRYGLKSRDRELVTLSEELEIVEKYLAIQKQRFRNNLSFHVNISPENEKLYLPPMALQILVENAIKHNIISKDKPLFINILSNSSNSINVENNLQKKISQQSIGQGLSNIKDRYSYFSGETIKIDETESHFKVTLPLIEIEA